MGKWVCSGCTSQTSKHSCKTSCSWCGTTSLFLLANALRHKHKMAGNHYRPLWSFALSPQSQNSHLSPNTPDSQRKRITEMQQFLREKCWNLNAIITAKSKWRTIIFLFKHTHHLKAISRMSCTLLGLTSLQSGWKNGSSSPFLLEALCLRHKEHSNSASETASPQPLSNVRMAQSWTDSCCSPAYWTQTSHWQGATLYCTTSP